MLLEFIYPVCQLSAAILCVIWDQLSCVPFECNYPVSHLSSTILCAIWFHVSCMPFECNYPMCYLSSNFSKDKNEQDKYYFTFFTCFFSENVVVFENVFDMSAFYKIFYQSKISRYITTIIFLSTTDSIKEVLRAERWWRNYFGDGTELCLS